MKKQLLALAVLFLGTITAFSQSPDLVNYQGVARDNSGNPLLSQAIGLKIYIISTSPTGNIEYSETFNLFTNAFGLFNVAIGSGTVVSGNMSTINWGSDAHYVRVDMDETGGTNYQQMGTSQLLSVPYSLYAETAGNGPPGPTGPGGSTGPAGPQGGTGAQGTQGNAGPQGPTGPSGGPVGPTGPQGPQGVQGPAGVQGPQGNQGPAGPAGPQGNQGPAGATGPQGAQGPAGPAGPQGNQGPAGVTGPQGAQGPAGPAGPQGNQGPQGIQGLQGATGVGLPGPTGPTGPGGGGQWLANGNDIYNGNTGNVGIGVTTPTNDLHVVSTDLIGARFETNNATNLAAALDAEYTAVGNFDGIAVQGTSTPADYYGYGAVFIGGYTGMQGQVTGTANGQYYATSGVSNGTGTGNNYGISGGASGTNTGSNLGVIGGASNGATNYAVYANGDLAYTGALINLSDKKFKENISLVSGETVLASVMKLEPQSYTYKLDEYKGRLNLAKGTHYGFIAQDVETVFPHVVSDNVHPVGDVNNKELKGNIDYKGIHYVELIPILVAAMKEQQKMIDAQQKEIDLLKLKIK